MNGGCSYDVLGIWEVFVRVVCAYYESVCFQEWVATSGLQGRAGLVVEGTAG